MTAAHRSPRRGMLALAAAASITGAAMAHAGVASATFPGENGRIAFSHSFIDDSASLAPQSQIRTIVPAGGDVRPLTPPTGDASDPAYSPDGRAVAYVRRVRGGDTEIFTMRANGRRTRRLTRNNVDDTSPAWSPTGRRIVFVRSTSRGKDIFTVRRNGRGLRRLTRNGILEEAPDWSPDGRWIAFMRESRRGQAKIYRMRANGRRVRPVTVGEFPSWSPDGRRIAFNRHTSDPGLREIFTVARNGGRPRRLTNELLDDIRPQWSPDGEWIVFTRDATKLWIIPSGGGEERLIVSAGAAPEDLSSYELLGFPSWQPR